MRTRRCAVGWFCLAGLGLGCGSNDASSDQGDDTVVFPDSGERGATGGSTKAAPVDAGRGADGGQGGRAGTGGNAGASGGKSGGSAGTGGATGVGGSTGSGGSSLPHVVGKCDHLGAVGEFETITPPQITPASDALSVFVAVHPQNSAIVYTSAGTWVGNRGFFQSTDCGSTWTKLDSGRNGQAMDTGFQWIMAVEPENGDVVYAVNGYGSPASLFKSTNGGQDWDWLFPDGSDVSKIVGFTQSVSMDPSNSKHLVVTFHENCKDPYAPNCLAESKDAGATWRLFRGPGSGWIEGAAPIALGATTFLFSAAFSGTYYTSDSGATWEKVADSGGEQVYEAADGSMYLGSNNGVMKSSDHGHHWTPIPGAPVADGLIGNGKFIYTTATAIWDSHPFFRATEGNPTTWTQMPGMTFKQGGSRLAYDADHHILYSSNYQGGLSRVVVE